MAKQHDKKQTDSKSGSGSQAGRERGGEKSASQQQRDDAGQFAGKRGQPHRGEDDDEGTESEWGGETYERGTQERGGRSMGSTGGPERDNP